MKKRCTGLLAFALAGVAAMASANAADLAVKAPVYKAPPMVVYPSWAGFYIGVNGGYGWGDTSGDTEFTHPEGVNVGNAKPKGGLFGGHAGYNWQYGKVVTGVELDFDGADINTTTTFDRGDDFRKMKFDELATARARLGYALLPDLLAYGTAGVAWGHSTLTGSDSGFISESHANDFGWAAGAGLEYHLGHGFIARAEYLHYDFTKSTYSSGFNGPPASASTTIDAVRGGLSYKF
jgi:outer membrane immunogenic protein